MGEVGGVYARTIAEQRASLRALGIHLSSNARGEAQPQSEGGAAPEMLAVPMVADDAGMRVAKECVSS